MGAFNIKPWAINGQASRGRAFGLLASGQRVETMLGVGGHAAGGGWTSALSQAAAIER